MPLLYAHRGAHDLALENTLPAFERAIALGADGIELDVRTSGSGDVLVCHDAHLGRLAGRSAFVAMLPTRYLRQIELHGGARLPLLDEVIDRVAQAWLRLNVEVKSDVPDRPAVARAVTRLLARRSAAEREAIVLSTFDPVVLLALRAHTRVPVAFLFDAESTGTRRAALALRALRPAGAHPHHALCTAERVRAWRSRGLFVNAWTVNDAARARELAALGVDGLITDDIVRLREALQSRVSV